MKQWIANTDWGRVGFDFVVFFLVWLLLFGEARALTPRTGIGCDPAELDDGHGVVAQTVHR